jgi:hypothetical protein
MASKKKQYNVVFDDNTDNLLWEVIADLKMTPTKAIRELIATHPAIIAKGKQLGISPDPDTTSHGGVRDVGKSSDEKSKESRKQDLGKSSNMEDKPAKPRGFVGPVKPKMHVPGTLVGNNGNHEE